MWRKLTTAALCAIAFGGAAQAEVGVVNMSKQFGLPYLPMIVIEAQQLIEKNAKAAGRGDVKTTWTQRVGPAAELDALLAGQADFIGPGGTTLATIWDKTAGTPQEVRALIAMQSMPFVLVTNNLNVKTIADFTGKDKIALPAVKLTGHAAHTGNGVRQDLGQRSLRQARFYHYHAFARGCGRRGDGWQDRNRFAFRQRPVLLLRAGDTRRPSGAQIL
jgi:hypothetical protein